MVHCIIPARFDSSRFPGKLLAKLGKDIVLNSTYSKAVASKIFDSVIVAAGDQAIFDFCGEHEIKCIKAFDEFLNGSERVIWTANELKLKGPVVNVQADQPLFNQLDLGRLVGVGLLTGNIATLLYPISKTQLNPLVKPVYATTNRENKILTFSRLNIPSGHSEIDFLLHIGIYYFPEDFWRNALKMNAFHNCNWSRTESLEQLNLLCSGFEIIGVEAHEFPPEINTLEDLQLANAFIEKVNHG